MDKGIVLITHGSKRKKSNDVFLDLVSKIDERREEKVLPAYMQFSEPALEDSVNELLKSRIEEIVVVPIFLFPGKHATRDIAKKVEKMDKQYGDVDFEIRKTIAPHEKLLDIIDDRIDN